MISVAAAVSFLYCHTSYIELTNDSSAKDLFDKTDLIFFGATLPSRIDQLRNWQ